MQRQNNFEYFMACLKKAAKRIDQHYFKPSRAGSDERIYRERVYCYELYHQLRCILGDTFPYKLDGEVDKQKHSIIHKLLGPKKPDFIFHVPGEMDRNLVVVEVKPITVNIDGPGGLREDLEKLRGFLNVGYSHAIMLVYGNGEQSRLLEKIKSVVEEFNEEPETPILLVWHPEPGKEPEEIKKEIKI